MNVLTWQGAVLRTDAKRERLVQEPVWMTIADGHDFILDAATPKFPPNYGAAYAGLELEAGSRPGMVSFRGPAGYLSAAPSRRDLTVDAEEDPTRQVFLLVASNDLADLRHILAHRWRVRPCSQVLEKADIRLGTGFSLALGHFQFELPGNLPLRSKTRRAPVRAGAYTSPPSFVIRPGDQTAECIELADGMPQTATPLEFELLTRQSTEPAETSSRETFQRSRECRLALPAGPPTYISPPLTLRARDSNLFAAWLETQHSPSIGIISHRFRIQRVRNSYVVLSRGHEGLVFDRDGAYGVIDHLSGSEALPAGLSVRDGRVQVDCDVLDAAPRLEGPLMVFYRGAAGDLARWLCGALPALDAMSRQAPKGFRLLLPKDPVRNQRGGTAFDHREVMNDLGFGRMPVVEEASDIVFVDDLIFADDPSPEAIPAEQLIRFRETVLSSHGGAGEPVRRVYLRSFKPGSVTLAHDIERNLLLLGFEIAVLEDLTRQQQVELFRDASFVIGAHGLGLSNILFAPPGVRILELIGDTSFQPDIWRLSAKLGHLYGFLGCQVIGEGEQARLEPDIDRFTELLAALEAFRF